MCAAPALPSTGGPCAFCGAALGTDGAVGAAAGAGLLDYLASRVPGVEATHGVLGKGPVRALSVRMGGATLHARQRRDGLELVPAVGAAEWVDVLVAAFTEAAGGDVATRRALSRTGWAWRRRPVALGGAVDA